LVAAASARLKLSMGVVVIWTYGYLLTL
jgi:hypothetical protein